MKRKKWYNDVQYFSKRNLMRSDTAVKVDAILKRGFRPTGDEAADQWLTSVFLGFQAHAKIEEFRKEWDQLGDATLSFSEDQARRYLNMSERAQELAEKALRSMATEHDRESYTLEIVIPGYLHQGVIIRDHETRITNWEENLNDKRVVDSHIMEGTVWA